MIKINDRFSLSRGRSGWTVHQKSLGTYRGKPVERVKKSHHTNMLKAMEYIQDIELGDCKDLKEVIRLLRKPL